MYMARWLSWLERRPVTAEVVGSSPIRVVYIEYFRYRTVQCVIRHTKYKWDLSSAGRASALQAEGHRFEPYRSHLYSRSCLSADVAQLAEQLICNQQVIGSSPIIGLSGAWNEHQSLTDRNSYGGIPEWPKGADCKSVSCAFSGSNPLSPTLIYLKDKSI